MMLTKMGKVGWVMVVVTVMVLSLSSSCSARFDDKHKNGRNSIMPGEASTSTLADRAGTSVVIPVDGNVYPRGAYYVTLNIGRPPRPYFLDVDTGSDLTWLQCDVPGSHCSRCSRTPHPLYKPSTERVPCKDPLCASLQPSEHYDCQDPDQCDYEIKYADRYSSRGVLINDDVYFLNFANEVQQVRVRMALGCGYQVFPPTYDPLDGMLGLGRGKTSFISQLNGKGLVRNVVGHCLSSQGGGYIFFGNVYDSFRVSWTPIKHYSAGPAELHFGGTKTGVGSLTAVFDAGSSYTYFNSEAYQAFISWLKKELRKAPIKAAPDDQTLPLCWHGQKPFKSLREVSGYFKPLALTFTNGGKVKTQFEIPLEAYLIISKMGNVCLGILNGSEIDLGEMNIIGDISMQDKVMVFDNEKQLIGWAHADCGPISRGFSV